MKLAFFAILLSLSTARAQIGATKEQMDARHIDPKSDFSFSYNLSEDGHVIFENWYSETYHSAKVALNQIEPAYTWKCKPEMGSFLNWFGTAPGKPPLHAFYYRSRAACHLFIARLADAPDKGKGGLELWDYTEQLKDLRVY
jgi:hypothetical protein